MLERQLGETGGQRRASCEVIRCHPEDGWMRQGGKKGR